MTLNEMMAQLAHRNVTLSTLGGELTINATKGSLTEELKDALRKYKNEILALLERSKEDHRALPEITINPEQRYEPFPFSDLQVGFYMADDPYMEYHVRPHYYCETEATPLDVARYEAALNKSVRRHSGEIVLLADDRHLKALQDIAPIKARINDFRALSLAAARAELMKLRERLKREQLPLDRWPWFDLQISLWMEDGVEQARIHMNHNNFYTDGFGALVLQNEIDRCYEDPDLTLAPLALTFRDAVLGLQALSQSSAGKRAQKYWLNRLADLPEPPGLPQRSGVNRRCRSRLQRRENFLSSVSWSQFKANASLVGLTPTSAIITAYAEVLCAWSGSQHFILSNMVTRRLPIHPEIRQIVGNFASLYPLEVDMRGDLMFSQKALRLQQQILRDSNNREWGGMQVMQAFNRLKGEFGSVPCPFVVGSGLFMEKYKKADFSCLETSQTILDHQFWELDDGRYYYVWDLLEEFFPEGMIDQMWQAFGRLLQALADDSSCWEQRCLSLAPPDDPHAPEIQAVGARTGGLLHAGLAFAVRQAPEKPVLQTPQASMSYQELDTLSASVAQTLQQHAVEPNELVALVMDRGPALLGATVGILKAGAAYVPIDPKLPTERIHYMLENSCARVVLTQDHYLATVSWPRDVKVIVVAGAARADATPRASPAVETDLAYVIYTSGSTGNPKGVMIDHRGALNTVADINDRFNIGPDDKVFGVSSFSFDLSVYDVFGVLDAGATLVYPDPAASLNPAHWLELLSSHEVTVWNSAPPLMSLLVETALRQQATLPALRVVMLSGDWIPVELPALIRKVAPNATIISLGGATEASIWSIYYVIDRVDPNWNSIPYGRPLTNQGWQIHDAMGRRAPVWAVGELFITGIGLALGYWGDAEKTRKSFIDDPVSGQRLYRTGDLGRYLPDGNIEFMGRVDSQVKVQGHRIELGEVEAALNENAMVKEAIVLAQPLNQPGSAAANSSKPNRAKQLVAYVVLREPSVADGRQDSGTVIQALRDFLAQKLPGYMVPTGWSLLERMPLSNNGKVDRNALAQVKHAGHAESGATRAAVVAPRNGTEARLAEIWKKVLVRDAVGVLDDFFEVGGQSFDAVRCVALIQEQFKKSLSLGDVWQDRTIEMIARRIDGHQQAEAGQRLFAISARQEGRPCFLVHPGGGQIIGYYELGQRLARPSYGFVALVEDADSDALATVEMIAARYISHMRSAQATGPYTLGGWSSGGCIAFEMAAQLEKMGEVVDRVILFDCPAPVVHARIEEIDMLRGFFEDLNLGLPSAVIDGRQLTGLGGEERFRKIIELFNRDAAMSLDSAQLYPFYRVFKKVVDAIRSYRPGAVRADLLVLRAADGRVTEFAGHPHEAREDWGWALLTAGSVRCETLAGTHHTLLKQGNVEAVATAVNQAEARRANRDSNTTDQAIEV